MACYHTEVHAEKKTHHERKIGLTAVKNLLSRMNSVSSYEHLKVSLRMISWVGCAFVSGSIGFSHAAILNETNFDNGGPALWDTFVTPNGTVGDAGWPTVETFPTIQEGQESESLKFKVGQVRYASEQEPEQGGGLVIKVTTAKGTIECSAHIAVSYASPKDRRNFAGGLFEWIIDDQVIARHDMGPINNHAILRHHLKAQHVVSAGVHTIRLRITRPFASHPGQHAPFQYVDDLLIRLLSHP